MAQLAGSAAITYHSPSMRRSVSIVVFLIGAAVMILIAAFISGYRIVPIAIAVLCLMGVASSFSVAGSLVESLRVFQGERVTIRVWGEALPGQTLHSRLLSVRAIGAGLHLFVKSEAGSPTHLKIAQPRHVQVETGMVTVNEASYVQWGGTKLPRFSGLPAVTIVVAADGAAF